MSRNKVSTKQRIKFHQRNYIFHNFFFIYLQLTSMIFTYLFIYLSVYLYKNTHNSAKPTRSPSITNINFSISLKQGETFINTQITNSKTLEFPSSSLSFHPFKKRKIIFPFTFISLFSFHSFFLLLFPSS
jgi:hypothetical protein